MNDILVMLGSPHAGGTTDALARLFARGAAAEGATVQTEALRDYTVQACIGCGVCNTKPHNCIFARKDNAERLFARMEQARVVLVAAPIYFYALPAPLKAFIDRSQRFWAAAAGLSLPQNSPQNIRQKSPQPATAKPFLALLAAGRPRGAQLFTGSLLTLKYFASHLGGHLADKRLLRGLDSPADLHEQPAVCTAVEDWGRQWARMLTARTVLPPAGTGHNPAGHDSGPVPPAEDSTI